MGILLAGDYFRPGTLNLLGGAPYAGKTTLLRTMLRASHKGDKFLGLDPGEFPSSWCHVVSDRDASEFFDKLIPMGVPMPSGWAHLWDTVAAKERSAHSRNISLRGQDYMREWLAKTVDSWAEAGLLAPGGLLTLDTAMPFVPNPKDYGKGLIAAQELRRIAVKHQIVILAVAHSGKFKLFQSAATPWERIQISQSIIGCTDTTVYVCSDLETAQSPILEAKPQEQLITVRGRRANPHYLLARMNGGVDFEFSREFHIGKAEHGGARVKAGRPRKVEPEALLDLLTDTPIDLEYLVMAAVEKWKISDDTAKRLVLLAANTGVIERVGNGYRAGRPS